MLSKEFFYMLPVYMKTLDGGVESLSLNNNL